MYFLEGGEAYFKGVNLDAQKQGAGLAEDNDKSFTKEVIDLGRVYPL